MHANIKESTIMTTELSSQHVVTAGEMEDSGRPSHGRGRRAACGRTRCVIIMERGILRAKSNIASGGV